MKQSLLLFPEEALPEATMEAVPRGPAGPPCPFQPGEKNDWLREDFNSDWLRDRKGTSSEPELIPCVDIPSEAAENLEEAPVSRLRSESCDTLNSDGTYTKMRHFNQATYTATFQGIEYVYGGPPKKRNHFVDYFFVLPEFADQYSRTTGSNYAKDFLGKDVDQSGDERWWRKDLQKKATIFMRGKGGSECRLETWRCGVGEQKDVLIGTKYIVDETDTRPLVVFWSGKKSDQIRLRQEVYARMQELLHKEMHQRFSVASGVPQPFLYQ
jgi:hypothetical protein